MLNDQNIVLRLKFSPWRSPLLLNKIVMLRGGVAGDYFTSANFDIILSVRFIIKSSNIIYEIKRKSILFYYVKTQK